MKNIIILIVTLTLITLMSCFTENKCKDYIIEHKNEIVMTPVIKSDQWTNNLHFKINNCKLSYYTDITIVMVPVTLQNKIGSPVIDSTYHIIFWGDRDSWKWKYKSDKIVDVNIPFNKYKGKNVEKDIELINILNNIK